jgi:5-methylthioadenosine/S-adenosylhomocysteine deaminase
LNGKVLIRGGCVLTLGAKTTNYLQADVLVENGKVAEIGTGLRSRDAEVIDATNTIVMPGFVDTHRHAWKSLFRNLGETGSSNGIPVSATIYGPHYEPEDVYAATLVGLLGAAEAGITTVVDWSDIPPEPGHVDAALEAHHDSGLRTVFVHALPGWDGGQEDETGGLRRLTQQRAHSSDSATPIAFGPRDPSRLDIDRVGREWGLARELGLRIHAHVGSEPTERGVISDLAQRGLLGEDVTLIHCSLLDDADVDAIAAHKTSVSLAPSSEMADGVGMPPIQQLIDRGIRPGLGVDSDRVTPGDIFAQMRAINSVQHATHFDLKLAGKGGLPNLLTTRQVIRFATVDGARVAGLGNITGSLEPGKDADIVVLRTDRPNIWPINDPIGAVVWGMDTSNVDWVFSAGRVLVRNGELTADVARVRDLASSARRRVGEASGLVAAVGGAV